MAQLNDSRRAQGRDGVGVAPEFAQHGVRILPQQRRREAVLDGRRRTAHRICHLRCAAAGGMGHLDAQAAMAHLGVGEDTGEVVDPAAGNASGSRSASRRRSRGSSRAATLVWLPDRPRQRPSGAPHRLIDVCIEPPNDETWREVEATCAAIRAGRLECSLVTTFTARWRPVPLPGRLSDHRKCLR